MAKNGMEYIILRKYSRKKCRQAKGWMVQQEVFRDRNTTEKACIKDKRNSKTENVLFERIYKIWRRKHS